MKKLIKAAILAITFLLVPTTIAYAAIATPDTFTINQINAYRHLRETDDQLYLVTFTIEYTANPSESAGEAWLIRLIATDNTVLGVANPYSMTINNNGYAQGCVTIYFTEDNAPTWSGNHTVELTGNPTLSWTAGDPPSTTSNTFASWSSSSSIGETSTELTARIRYIAQVFEDDWASDLIETTPSGTQLTANGIDYFTNSIPYLRNICPALFPSTMIVPEFEERDYSQTYATAMETRWVGDALLDLSGLATTLGVSTMWATSIGWLIFTVMLCMFLNRYVNSYQITALAVAIMLVTGSLLGLMPFVIAPIVGALGLLAVVYNVAWSGAS